jgi:signal peptidase I
VTGPSDGTAGADGAGVPPGSAPSGASGVEPPAPPVSAPVGSEPTAPLASAPVTPEPVTPEPVTPEPVTPDTVTPEPLGAQPIASEPPRTEPSGTAPVAAEAIVDEPLTETVGPADAEPAPSAKDKKHEGSFLRELPVLLVIAFVLALIIKAFLVQAFFIPSGSMEQTLHGCPGCSGDRVLVNKLVYRFRDINRGEVVVFNGLDSFQAEVIVPPPKNRFDSIRRKISSAIGLGSPGEKDFIKRVIGLPGDVVACCTNGNVTVNGVELHEPYVFEDDHQRFAPTTVPAGKLFVMGDHRSRSSDSRANGPVPIDKVVGRAFVVVWPPSRMKGLPVPGEIEHAGVPAAPAAALPAPAWSVAATPPVLGLGLALPVTALRRRRRRARLAA